MFDFTKLTRRQRIILRNRTERLSELLDWNTLGIVTKIKTLTNRIILLLLLLLFFSVTLVLLSCKTNGFNKNSSRIWRRITSICKKIFIRNCSLWILFFFILVNWLIDSINTCCFSFIDTRTARTRRRRHRRRSQRN